MKFSSVSGLSLLLFFVVSGIFSSLATAQEVPRLPAAFTRLFAQEMERQMRYAPEQIHLFTDREVYAAGDTIWLSGWVLNDQTLEPTTHSRRLYVDLINPQLKVVQDLVLELANGTAYGSFVLSENQTTDAFFQLRAYTQWSMHFDSTYTYHRILPVWQKAPVVDSTARPNKYQLVKRGVSGRYELRRIRPPKEGDDEAVTGDDSPATDSLPFIDVAFLPEGGSWVEGIPCRMAFKALAPDGYGVEIEGDILDQNDSLICSFQSEHLGMGSFLITPQPGISYTACLFTGQRIEMTRPASSGVALMAEYNVNALQGGSGATLTATMLLSPGELDPKRILYLVVQSPGYKPETYALRCDLPLQGNTKLTLWAHNSSSTIRRFNVGFELDPQQELQKPKVYAPRLPAQSFGVMALLDAFRKQKEMEAFFLDSLKRLPGIQYIEEVAISAKRIIKNSYNKNGPGKADIILDEKAMGKFDRFSNLLEVLEHEVPGFRKGYLSVDREYFSTVPRGDLKPEFVIGERPVEFRFDGGPFPFFGSPPATPQGWEELFEEKATCLRNLAVSQLVGVEVMTSLDYIYRYQEGETVSVFAPGSLNYRRFCVIDITTKEGIGIPRPPHLPPAAHPSLGSRTDHLRRGKGRSIAACRQKLCPNASGAGGELFTHRNGGIG